LTLNCRALGLNRRDRLIERALDWKSSLAILKLMRQRYSCRICSKHLWRYSFFLFD